MKLIIAGGRDFDDYDDLCYELDHLYPAPKHSKITLITGCAQGADQLGRDWAASVGVEEDRYPANWAAYGKQAGPIRNGQMAAVADVLVAFWDGKSNGTRNMIDTAVSCGLEVHVYRYENEQGE